MSLTRNIFYILFACLFVVSLVIYPGFHDQLNTSQQLFEIGIVSLLIMCISFEVLFKSENFRINLNTPDVLLLLLVLYLFVNSVFNNTSLNIYSFINFIISITIYFITRYIFNKKVIKINELFIKFYVIVIPILILIHLTIGCLQYFEIINSLNTLHKITGNFYNPGPYSIFLSCFFPIIFNNIFSKEINHKLRYLNLIVAIGIVFILILTKSRTSWIAILISTSFFVFRSGKIKSINKIFSKLRLIILSAILIIPLVVVLFNYKKDSSIGRLFIWKGSVQLILEKPMIGHGFDRFQPEYNEFQESYFRENPNSKYTYLASDQPLALNEFLQISVEWGLIGLILFVLFLISVFWKTKKEFRKNDLFISIEASIITIFIAFLFSYPLRVLPISIICFTFLAILSSRTDQKIISLDLSKLKRFTLSFIGFLTSALLILYTYSQFNAQLRWKKAYNIFRSGNTNLGITLYQKSYNSLKNDKYFLYNYGQVLSDCNRLDESITKLLRAKSLIYDTDVLCSLGDVYEKLGDYKNAIETFEKASYLIPYKFYPHYRLVPLYYVHESKQKAIITASKVLNMKEKVPSEEVDYMKAEIEEFINKISD